jgi:hypothetical protein
MSLADLAVVYLVVGACCGVAVWRVAPEPGPRAIASAMVAVPLWPLWAPIALTAGRGATPPAPLLDPAARSIEATLAECVAACSEGPLASLLRRDAADAILAGVRRAATRRAELDAVLARPDFDLAAAERRVDVLVRADASARSLATARLHLDNVRRLHALHAGDARALAELADLVAALRTQLTLARFGAMDPGAAADGAEGIGAIVAEVWARVEGLGAAMGSEETRA